MSYFEFPHTRTYDSDLGWLIKTVKEMAAIINTLEEWQREHEEAFEQFQALYDAIISGNFPESIVNAFYSWMSRNALDLVGQLVKMVIFGLTDDGHFVAYIPESWADIIFNTTGLDITIPGIDYGHLTLSFNV